MSPGDQTRPGSCSLKRKLVPCCTDITMASIGSLGRRGHLTPAHYDYQYLELATR